MNRASRWLIISIFTLLSLSMPLQAEETQLPAESVELSNQIIISMYQDILDQKTKYPELEDFGEGSLYKNDQGIYTLIYDHVDERSKGAYGFGVTINAIDALDFKGREGQFNYGFPKLNLKITGFLNKQSFRTQYDIMPLISKYGVILAEYQQNFMPLRIFIRPAKEAFKVGEEIEFDLILKNVSKRHMRVKPLGKDSLYFFINDQEWEISPVGQSSGREKVLMSGENITLRLKGESFQEPANFVVTCFYGMSIDGTNPMAKATISVVE